MVEDRSVDFATPCDAGKAGSMKILIVDDTRLMLRILGELLHRNGYETVEAKSTAQAVKRLSVDRKIDAVITDLDMEPMNGVELFRLAQTLYRITDSGTIALFSNKTSGT